MAEGGSNDSSQEKTEEPTQKRLKDSRDKGTVPRSRDLNTALIVVIGAAAVMFFSTSLFNTVMTLTRKIYQLDKQSIFDVDQLVVHLGNSFGEAILALIPIFVVVVVVALGSPALLGGWSFSIEAAYPKYERISFLKGIKRIFSVKGLMELFKALLKFSLIGTCAITLIWMQREDVLALSNMDISDAVEEGLSILIYTFIALSLSLIIIAAIDIPFQIHSYMQQVKMTQQEVREEMKQTEGRPEVKSKIRSMQQDAARQRMMSEVPTADVVITNPEHFAVALRYDEKGSGAPLLVAKGGDLIAQRIREVAKANDVAIVEFPPLARAIYYSTDLEREIPAGLYVAVAQVLAYVFHFKRYENDDGPKPDLILDEDAIPSNLKR